MKMALWIAGWLTLIASAVIASAEALPQSESRDSSNSGARMTEEISSDHELVARGKRLRLAIDKKFKELRQAHLIKGGSSNRNLIRDTILEYIPLGISFDDAEIILRSAGFSTSPRGEILPQILKGNIGVLAFIDPYPSGMIIGRTIIGVTLRPKSKNDWSQIKELETEISIITS